MSKKTGFCTITFCFRLYCDNMKLFREALYIDIVLFLLQDRNKDFLNVNIAQRNNHNVDIYKK